MLEIIGPAVVIVGSLVVVWYIWIRDEDKNHSSKSGDSKAIPESIFRDLPKDKQDELKEDGYHVIPGA